MTILLACGAFWLFAFIYYQASLFEQRRKASLALRKECLAHDEAVRKEYGYYPAIARKTAYLSPYECLNDDTREIPTIEDENTGEDIALSDIWEQAIDELELGE